MECSVRLAEINNDTQTAAQERAYMEARHHKWKLYVRVLLQGMEIHENNVTYTLAERLANEFPEFATFVDVDYDFMTAYNNGDLPESVNKLIQSESRILASKIMGDL